MEQDSQQFDVIAAKLKSELSLQTDEEFFHDALKESHDIYEHLQKEYQKGLDEIELTEHDLDLLDYIKGQLPYSFWVLNGLSENLYINTSLVSLQKYSYWLVDDFVTGLCKLGNEDIVTDYNPYFEFDEPSAENDKKEEENDYDIESLIKTIDVLQSGVFMDEKEQVLTELFEEQTRQNKIKIIRHVLSNKKTEYTRTWNFILTDIWWDDELKPDLEKWWSSKDCACVVVKRFPNEYVKEHLFELSQSDYCSVCNLLAKEKGFSIDKSRLRRFEYMQILADNHIHVLDEYADSLLFDHIMIWLHKIRKKISEGKTVDWREYGWITPGFINHQDYQSLLSHWFNYKPSLYELPWTGRLALNLCFMGNTNTVAKLIVWNQFLRSNLQSYSEENEMGTIKLERVAEEFDDNIDRNWRRFIELAIETCPVEKAKIEDWFMPDEDDELKLE